jgi:hypothetical protein
MSLEQYFKAIVKCLKDLNEKTIIHYESPVSCRYSILTDFEIYMVISELVHAVDRMVGENTMLFTKIRTEKRVLGVLQGFLLIRKC